jgi:2-methylcitrate dehydratase PrpD
MAAQQYDVRLRPAPSQTATVTRRFARFALGLVSPSLPAEVVAKAKLCLIDFLSCAIESRELPWSRQATAFALAQGGDGATVIGTHSRAAPAEAAFANATMGHGLIREDMHPPSNSHIGVVVLPTLLALGEAHRVTGSDFLAAVVVGYEIAGRLGRALVDREVARRFRPTGLVGPAAAAAAGARTLGLDEDTAVNAIAFGANTAGGFNEWPHVGGTEVFFHAGFASRSAVTAVELAMRGARASETAIDGRAGLLAAFGRAHLADEIVPLADGSHEILSVYFKPAPACNYVQTACQAALQLVERDRIASDAVAAVRVCCFPDAISYPGCDYIGPFDSFVQAKMSIQFSVAAVIARRAIEEANYARLDDPEVLRLAVATTLEVDDEFAAAFPSKQGTEIVLTMSDGSVRSHRLDDVIPCTPACVYERFWKAASSFYGELRAGQIEETVNVLDRRSGACPLWSLLTARDKVY